MADWSEREIEDFVLGEFGENHGHSVPHQGVRPVEEPQVSGDFLVARRHNIENNVGNSANSKVSRTRGVLGRKEGINICPSLEIGNSSVAAGLLPHAYRNNVSMSQVPLSVAMDFAFLTPEDCQMVDNHLKQCNIGLESNRCSTSNPIGASRGAAEEIGTCQLSFDNNTSADSKLTFLENDNDRENDLLYYDWSDISNFDDVDKMFRNCDPTFGQWSNTDGLSWIPSSSNDMFGPEDAFTSSFESSTLYFREPAYCANIGSLPESSTPAIDNHKQSCLTQQSFQLVTSAEQAYDGGEGGDTKSALTEFGNFEQPPINIHTQQLNRQYPSEVEGKGLESYPSQLLPKQTCFMKSDSSSYMHALKPDGHVEDKLLYEDLFLPTTSSTITECKQNPSSSFEVSAHVISNTSQAMKNLPDCLSKDSVMKLKEMVEKPSIGPLELTNSVKQQCDNFEQEIGSDTGKMSLELHAAEDSRAGKSSSVASVFSNDISVKAISFQQLQDVIGQLDLRTKLCIRDSLYRLARSAEQRHSFATANNENMECRRVHYTGKSVKSSEYMDMETGTNPIDRSVAHLLFHRPPESASRSADDAMSLESHMMA